MTTETDTGPMAQGPARGEKAEKTAAGRDTPPVSRPAKLMGAAHKHVTLPLIVALIAGGLATGATMIAGPVEAAVACGPEATALVRKGEVKFADDDLEEAKAYATRALRLAKHCQAAHWLSARVAHRRMRLALKMGEPDSALKAKQNCWDEVVYVGGLWGLPPEVWAVRQDCE